MKRKVRASIRRERVHIIEAYPQALPLHVSVTVLGEGQRNESGHKDEACEHKEDLRDFLQSLQSERY